MTGKGTGLYWSAACCLFVPLFLCTFLPVCPGPYVCVSACRCFLCLYTCEFSPSVSRSACVLCICRPVHLVGAHNVRAMYAPSLCLEACMCGIVSLLGVSLVLCVFAFWSVVGGLSFSGVSLSLRSLYVSVTLSMHFCVCLSSFAAGTGIHWSVSRQMP
jgi:hypothetical protein